MKKMIYLLFFFFIYFSFPCKAQDVVMTKEKELQIKRNLNDYKKLILIHKKLKSDYDSLEIKFEKLQGDYERLEENCKNKNINVFRKIGDFFDRVYRKIFLKKEMPS